jgi:hypothetical protein
MKLLIFAVQKLEKLYFVRRRMDEARTQKE